MKPTTLNKLTVWEYREAKKKFVNDNIEMAKRLFEQRSLLAAYYLLEVFKTIFPKNHGYTDEKILITIKNIYTKIIKT